MSVEKIFIIFIKRGVRLYNNAPLPSGMENQNQNGLPILGKNQNDGKQTSAKCSIIFAFGDIANNTSPS